MSSNIRLRNSMWVKPFARVQIGMKLDSLLKDAVVVGETRSHGSFNFRTRQFDNNGDGKADFVLSEVQQKDGPVIRRRISFQRDGRSFTAGDTTADGSGRIDELYWNRDNQIRLGFVDRNEDRRADWNYHREAGTRRDLYDDNFDGTIDREERSWPTKQAAPKRKK
jgi:hypothetical protein